MLGYWWWIAGGDSVDRIGFEVVCYDALDMLGQDVGIARFGFVKGDYTTFFPNIPG